MQGLHATELVVGEMVVIDWPRTRWDGRQGMLREIRHDLGQASQGFVYLSCMLVHFPLASLHMAGNSPSRGAWVDGATKHVMD
jgi:hypothetical protein